MTLLGDTWWYRLEGVAIPTERGKNVYDDTYITVAQHTIGNKLVGHEILLKRTPIAPIVCWEYYAFVSYDNNVENVLKTVFADHYLRVFSLGVGLKKTYLITVRNGSVDCCAEGVLTPETLYEVYDGEEI